MLLLSLLRCTYYQGCAQQTFTWTKQTGSSSTKETITHHFFVSGIGQKKTVDAAKICGGAENVVKTKPANIRKWIARFFYYLFILRWKRVCIAHNNCMSCPSIWATLSALLINMLLGSFQLFLHNWSASLWGWNNPVQRVSASRGRLHYPRRRRNGGFALTDRRLWCATDDDQRQHHHAEHHFQL